MKQSTYNKLTLLVDLIEAELNKLAKLNGHPSFAEWKNSKNNT